MNSSSQLELLTVAQVASQLAVSTKTIRRWIKQRRIVSHKLNHIVRVDARSVARILAQAGDELPRAEEVRAMENTTRNDSSVGEPRLLRQQQRSRVWIGWLDFREVPLGTTDKEEALRRLTRMADERRRRSEASRVERATPLPSGRRPFRVYPEGERFVVKYYDDAGRRRKHWIPSSLAVPVSTLLDAEEYAARWYRGELEGRPLSGVEEIENADLFHAGTTFEEFGRLWTSGKLAARFEDHVKLKASGSDDESRLRIYVYPLVGAERVVSFEGRAGLELAEQVVAGLPPAGRTFSKASRRHVLQTLRRLLTLAVYPAKLLSANPLPKGFVPSASSDKAKSYLYPEEDSALMRYTAAPLQERLLYGVLAREGLRLSELLDLTWADVDLVRGVLRLDENKTNDPRSWPLDPGVVRALAKWRERFVPRAAASVPVLAAATGKRIEAYGAAERLREYLRSAGVKRAELFQSSESRLPLRAHDLRATFVTVHLALGKSEAWITDRTGHKSSQMIYRYKRRARTYEQLGLGALESLNEAIPELR